MANPAICSPAVARLVRAVRDLAPRDVSRQSITVRELLDDVDHPDRIVVVVAFLRANEPQSWELAVPRELLDDGHGAC